ncbi:unnamed protein product [Bursaphelenchus okinawaensis]|uniref:Uncharacterized protein n=1 Tax=Bursaphelenchus okinawaensis TaxID=465554 RepID=A0A811LNH1_9BILA|nr:unnamed protein product [Bursaphelenchus okinawaensis]CAG9127277.1 unnamed protein product [Bursaphelenchus okinawaensis]
MCGTTEKSIEEKDDDLRLCATAFAYEHGYIGEDIDIKHWVNLNVYFARTIEDDSEFPTDRVYNVFINRMKHLNSEKDTKEYSNFIQVLTEERFYICGILDNLRSVLQNESEFDNYVILGRNASNVK